MCVKLLFLSIASCFIVSCGEKMTSVSIYLENSTNHNITIKPFYKGISQEDKFLYLNRTGTKVKIEHYSHRGILYDPIFFGDYFTNVDSIQLWWNDSFYITYMISGSYQSSKKFIEYGGERSLTHPDLYQKKLMKDKRKRRVWEMISYFTEEDYNFAKD